MLVYKNQWLMDQNGTHSNGGSRKNSKVSRGESLKIPHDKRDSFVRSKSIDTDVPPDRVTSLGPKEHSATGYEHTKNFTFGDK